MGAVREVQTADVHALGDEMPEDVVVIAGGTDGPDDLCFTHNDASLVKKPPFQRVSKRWL
jgi:hypothetical protein